MTAHPAAAEITAEAAAMAAERLGYSLRSETEADWIPVVTDWGSDGPVGWIDLEGGLRLRFTVELTAAPERGARA